MAFYVHENLHPASNSDYERIEDGRRPNHDYTMIHVGECQFCNFGTGIRGFREGENYEWHPKDNVGFSTYAEARSVAELRGCEFGPYNCTKPRCVEAMGTS